MSGGVLIIDDYGWWQGSRQAVDEFLEKSGERLLLVRMSSGRNHRRRGPTLKLFRVGESYRRPAVFKKSAFCDAKGTETTGFCYIGVTET